MLKQVGRRRAQQVHGGNARPAQAARQTAKHIAAARLAARARWPPRAGARALHRAEFHRDRSSEAIICKRWLVQVYDELCARFRYGWDGDVVIVLVDSR